MDREALAHLRHELRTPLNHIIGYSEMLIEDAQQADPAQLGDGLRQVHSDAKQLLGAIGELVRADVGPVDLGALSARLSPPLEAMTARITALQSKAAQAGLEREAEDLARIATAAAALQSVAAQGQLFHAAAENAAPAPEADGGAILVVDDNAGNRELLARRLERDGHRVRVAESGRAGLDLMRTQPIDLVLLDVMMPEMDGYEVLRQIKATEDWRDIPVLMISALDEMDSVVRCIELGAEDYLAKPFDPVLLRARIGACLEKKRLRDSEARHRRQLAEWNRTLEQRVAEQVAMVERLGKLKRFFSPQLAELIVAGGAEDPLKTHRRDITVVFLDLRGFTAFAESAEPEDVMGVLREYHAEMGQIIVQHEGTLERFTGDGMMIFFNDPVPVPDAAERAVRMALAMRDRVSELLGRWRRLGHRLGLGIGIAQGYATIGAIGFEGRMDYGAIGSVTNLAARLCGEAQPGQILVSERVLAPLDGLCKVAPIGELTLKGFARPVPAYDILGLE